MSEVVLLTVDDGVAVLTLNRPERLNAWTAEMERTYFGLLEECAEREHVRAIVVTAAAAQAASRRASASVRPSAASTVA